VSISTCALPGTCIEDGPCQSASVRPPGRSLGQTLSGVTWWSRTSTARAARAAVDRCSRRAYDTQGAVGVLPCSLERRALRSHMLDRTPAAVLTLSPCGQPWIHERPLRVGSPSLRVKWQTSTSPQRHRSTAALREWCYHIASCRRAEHRAGSDPAMASAVRPPVMATSSEPGKGFTTRTQLTSDHNFLYVLQPMRIACASPANDWG
jgi:hypothetical protein